MRIKQIKICKESLPLAEVEVGVGAVRAALNLEESSVLVLVAETTSVTDEDRFSVKTAHGQLF